MNFCLLAERPEFVPTVVEWLFDEWGNPGRGDTLEGAIDRMRNRMSIDHFPVHVIALEDNSVIAFAALKFPEMDLDGREHWLGSVYVAPAARGRGVASALVEEMIRRARAHDIKLLTLQTEQLDGGLYAKLGWTAFDQVQGSRTQVLLMELRLA